MKSTMMALASAFLVSGSVFAHGGMGAGAMYGMPGQGAMAGCGMQPGGPKTSNAEACPMREGHAMGGRMAMNRTPSGAEATLEGCPMHGGAGPKGQAGGAMHQGRGTGMHEGMRMHHGDTPTAPEAPAR